MLCRAPSSATTCAGTHTGAQLAYDNEGRLTSWQNAPTAPTSTDAFLYDGEGQRVLQQSTSGGIARDCPRPTGAWPRSHQVHFFMGHARDGEEGPHIEIAATSAIVVRCQGYQSR